MCREENEGRRRAFGTRLTYRLLLFLNLPRALMKVALAEKGACTLLLPPSVVAEDGREAGGTFFLPLFVEVEGEAEERGAFGTPFFKGIVGAGVIVVDVEVAFVVVVGSKGEEVGRVRVLPDAPVEMPGPTPPPPPPPPLLVDELPDILACALEDGSDLMWMSQWPKMALDVDSSTLREGRR